MSEFKNDMISDESLRQLLQLCILEGDDNDVITQQIINMETSFALGSDAFLIPAIPGEQLLLNKIKMGLGKSLKLKWLFSGLIIAAVGTGLYLGINKPHPETQNKLALTPVMTVNDSEVTVLDSPVFSSSSIPQLPLISSLPIIPVKPEISIFDNPDFIAELPPVLDYTSFISTTDSPETDNSYCKGSRKIPAEVGQYNLDTVFNGVTKIEVDMTFGNISVNPGTDNKTFLKSVITIDGKLRKHKGHYLFTYEKNGPHLKISFRPGSNVNIVGRTVNLTGEVQITTPPGTMVSLKNSSGNIALKGLNSKSNSVECSYGHVVVEDMVSNVNIVDRSGQVSVKNIKGNANIQANYGNVLVKEIHGALNVISGSGQINAEDIEGECRLEAKYGHITLNDVKGLVDISSTSGNIVAKNITGQHCNVVSRYGHIDLNTISAKVTIESSSGNVKLTDIIGDIKIDATYGRQNLSHIIGKVVTFSRSGDISITQLQGDLELESSYGNVNLNDCKGKVKITMTSGNLNAWKLELVDALDIYSKYGNVKIQLENNVKDLSFELFAPSGKLKVSKGDVNNTSEDSRLIIKNGKIQIKCYTASGSQEFF